MKSVKRRKLKMTGHPEVETDGRGGATMIWRLKTKPAPPGPKHLREKPVVLSMP